MTVRATAHLASVRSQFQQIDVYETEALGRILLLDGHVQLSTFDERAYHEALVWVPLSNLPSAKSVLVVGGGDGGVLREVCKHPTVERVDMVEIDAEVVAVCGQYLPEVSGGAFDDPRVRLHIADAFEFVKGTENRYDLVVVDCTDVYEEEEGEISEMLFSEGFYRDVSRCLNDDGLVVTQADNVVFCPYSSDAVVNLYKSVFPKVGTYWALVPSFGGYSGFCWAGRTRSISTETSTNIPPMSYLSKSTLALGFSAVPFRQ